MSIYKNIHKINEVLRNEVSKEVAEQLFTLIEGDDILFFHFFNNLNSLEWLPFIKNAGYSELDKINENQDLKANVFSYEFYRPSIYLERMSEKCKDQKEGEALLQLNRELAKYNLFNPRIAYDIFEIFLHLSWVGLSKDDVVNMIDLALIDRNFTPPQSDAAKYLIPDILSRFDSEVIRKTYNKLTDFSFADDKNIILKFDHYWFKEVIDLNIDLLCNLSSFEI